MNEITKSNVIEILEAFDESRMRGIKMLRTYIPLGLREAHEFTINKSRRGLEEALMKFVNSTSNEPKKCPLCGK